MRGFLMFADAAVVHPDGSVTVVRGGLNRVICPQPPTGPIQFPGALWAYLLCDAAEAGHPIPATLSCASLDGTLVMPTLNIAANMPAQAGTSNLCVRADFAFPAVGTYEFRLLIADLDLRCRMEIVIGG